MLNINPCSFFAENEKERMQELLWIKCGNIKIPCKNSPSVQTEYVKMKNG